MNKNQLKEITNLNFSAFDFKNFKTEELKRFLITMVRIRLFEERIAELVTQEKIITPCHRDQKGMPAASDNNTELFA